MDSVAGSYTGSIPATADQTATDNLYEGRFKATTVECLFPRILGKLGYIAGWELGDRELKVWDMHSKEVVREFDQSPPDKNGQFVVGEYHPGVWIGVLSSSSRRSAVSLLGDTDTVTTDDRIIDPWFHSDRSRQGRANCWGHAMRGLAPCEMPSKLKRGTRFENPNAVRLTCKAGEVTIWKSNRGKPRAAKTIALPITHHSSNAYAYGRDPEGYPTLWVVNSEGVTMLSTKTEELDPDGTSN